MMPSGKGKQTPKGKGNGKHNGGKGSTKLKDAATPSTSKFKEKDCSSPESKDGAVPLPNLQIVDTAKAMPRFSAVLNRPENDGVGMEDLDTLQLELEMLLSSLAVRERTLNAEMEALNSSDDKKEKKKSSLGRPPASPGKRGKHHDDRPSKKFKDMLGKAKDSPGLPSKPPKPKVSDSDLPDLSGNTVGQLPLKNDVPNKFWASVDPFCADVTQEDIAFLEEQIQSHDDDADYLKIPPLGKHYMLRWAQEDLLDEQREGSKGGGRKRAVSNGSSGAADVEQILKKAESTLNDESLPFGSLTQRLVSALIEEGYIGNDPGKTDNNLESDAPTRPGLIKSLGITNGSALERQLKKELVEQGILDADEPTAAQDQANDEILQELRRCQAELKSISSFNHQQFKRLLKLSQEQMVRQELKQKLKLADAEVSEAYRRIAAARQKKKPPTKKEKDQAWKALKDREAILKQLDAI